MIVFIIRRCIQALLVMVTISVLAFAIQSQLGDPVRMLTSDSTSAKDREIIREQLGLNDPIYLQYLRFASRAIQGDFGTSYFFKRSSLAVILERLPATLELVIVATLIIISYSLPFGIFCAVFPQHWLTKSIMAISVIGISIPVFLTAIMLIYVFAVELGWMPSFGRGETVQFGFWQSNFFTVDGWQHIILPAITLSSIMLPLFVRLIRSEMVETLQQEYIRFARSKGLSETAILFKHALRNVLVPIVTVGGLQIGTMIAYTILTETVFQWPGMGFMFLEAVSRSDLPLISTYLIVVGAIFIITNTIVDILYGVINPTINLVTRNTNA